MSEKLAEAINILEDTIRIPARHGHVLKAFLKPGEDLGVFLLLPPFI